MGRMLKQAAKTRPLANNVGRHFASSTNAHGYSQRTFFIWKAG